MDTAGTTINPQKQMKMNAISMLRFTAASTLYRSPRNYLMRSVSAGSSGVGVIPQQASTFVPPCSNPLGGCYPAPDGSFLSICPCGSTGTCGSCFDLSVEGYDLGSKNICLCQSQSVPPLPCCPPKTPKCCGVCRPRPDGTGLICDGTCIGPSEHCQ